jgi:hypothetical protein
MLALQNFLMVVVLPILIASLAIGAFRWWLRRSTGYDPANIDRSSEAHSIHEADSYAPYIAPKWKEDEKQLLNTETQRHKDTEA